MVGSLFVVAGATSFSGVLHGGKSRFFESDGEEGIFVQIQAVALTEVTMG